MSDVLGGIKVNNMIWFVTILTLGSLFICWNNYDQPNPSIMDTTKTYPYTILFRVCMMYSLFIYFLIFMFIKWWIDSSQFASHTRSIVAFSTIGVLSYGLFVSCIDRERINYPLAKAGVCFAGIFITAAIWSIMHQLRKIRKQTPLFIGQTSFNLKKITSSIQGFGFFCAVLIFTGQLSIDYKNRVQYIVVISSILFVWTFIWDFKRFKMDVDRIPKQNVMNYSQNIRNMNQQNIVNMINQPQISVQNQYVYQPQFQAQQQQQYQQQMARYTMQQQPYYQGSFQTANQQPIYNQNRYY